MSGSESSDYPFSALEVPIDRDRFLRKLIRELAGTLEGVVGLEEASGFVSVVGERVGDFFDNHYRRLLGVSTLSRDQVANALVDLKRRIQGDFYVVEADEEKIVLGNRRCPFGEFVAGRPSMCMMTSNVFGTIAAQNLGRAKVALDETIASGGSGCKVTIYLKQTPQADAAEGREYFRSN